MNLSWIICTCGDGKKESAKVCERKHLENRRRARFLCPCVIKTQGILQRDTIGDLENFTWIDLILWTCTQMLSSL